jgi:glycerol-3-phosphate acyltransferase PlsX
MRIILDALGGDHAPLAVLKGGALAHARFGADIVFVGDEQAIRSAADTEGIDLACFEVVHAPRAMPIEAEATDILKDYADSSMAVGLKLLAEGKGDAFVSAGSTAALLVGATFIVKRSKGVKRPAIATLIPCYKGRYLLVDSGANHECRPDMLCQFGIMGSVYMSRIAGIKSPRVGLVNIGTEPSKGTELYVESHKRLSEAPINFIGNIEPRDIPLGGCDVAVADGFTGNVMLKLSEGFGSFIKRILKDMLTRTAGTKIAALLLRGSIATLSEDMDYSSEGGAPLLGIAKPVIKAHGSSNAVAIMNAVRQAKLCIDTGMIAEIEAGIARLKEDPNGTV